MEKNPSELSTCLTKSSEEVNESNIIEEGPRICPLCSSEVRLFFIHFNEKMLMCENTECDYPFGYEDLQFVRIENDEEVSDVGSVTSRTVPFSPSGSVAGSVLSTSGWSEIDKINRVYESEDSQLEPRTSNASAKKKNKKIISNKESQKLIQKNVEDLKGLSLELMEITKPKKIIKNEKWIKNLINLQGQSGVTLVKPQELKNLKKEENDIKTELKIDIDPGDSNSLSSIKIEIANQS